MVNFMTKDFTQEIQVAVEMSGEYQEGLRLLITRTGMLRGSMHI